MKFYCILLSICMTNFVFAQKETDTLKSNNQISRKKWSGWKMNGKSISWKEAKESIRQVPEALPYLKKAYNQEKLAYLCLVPLTVSVLMLPEAGAVHYNQRNILARSISAASAVAIIYFMLQRNKHHNKAILIHNEKRAVTY